MAYELVIGDRMYSSWSLRAWLIFEQFGIPVSTKLAPMLTPAFHETLADYAPARLVPVIRTAHAVVWDTTAIAETLAEENPGLWPESAGDRALARALVAEMHTGFPALRNTCPMNLRTRFEAPAHDGSVTEDLTRLAHLWSLPGARTQGPWLFGTYSIADAFFAPVAARIAGYSLNAPGAEPYTEAYVAAHLAHGPFRRWRAMAFASDRPMERYEDNGLARFPWPGPQPVPAEAVAEGTAINTDCPYSGTPIRPDSLARIDGQIIGFCNTFCRDKSVADPEAWPKLTALRESLTS